MEMRREGRVGPAGSLWGGSGEMGMMASVVALTVAAVQDSDHHAARQTQVRLRRRLRHQLRVRLRLPARQHGAVARGAASSAATRFAIVDEVDNILIDEARTPLIISGAPEEAARPTTPVRAAGQAAGGRAAQREAEGLERVEGPSEPTSTTSTTRSTRPSRRPSAASRRPRSSSASTTSTSPSTATSSTTSCRR